MPCKDPTHTHVWPDFGVHTFRIESCEAECDWCPENQRGKVQKNTSNLRQHAQRHINNPNDARLRGITIAKEKAGRKRLVTKPMRNRSSILARAKSVHESSETELVHSSLDNLSPPSTSSTLANAPPMKNSFLSTQQEHRQALSEPCSTTMLSHVRPSSLSQTANRRQRDAIESRQIEVMSPSTISQSTELREDVGSGDTVHAAQSQGDITAESSDSLSHNPFTEVPVFALGSYCHAPFPEDFAAWLFSNQGFEDSFPIFQQSSIGQQGGKKMPTYAPGTGPVPLPRPLHQNPMHQSARFKCLCMSCRY